ncbi:MAG: VCBS repeat-containing protein [Candidatus Zixiibacteriota bacterium]|nr:MAG: VCBS repeat-containing protein [candidate division Zixibacteria bacterium]
MKVGDTLILGIMPVVGAMMIIGGSVRAEVKMSDSPVMSVNYGVSFIGRGAWGDIDKNGWLDLVVAGGADVGADPDAIYFNAASGMETIPSWISDYSNGSALLDVLDFDGDGYLDIVVPNFGLPPLFSPRAQFMYSNEDGTVSSQPVWTSIPMNAWSLAAADIDGDGDIDVAIPDFALANPKTVKVFYNNGGSFDSSPNWESDSVEFAWDVAFADINRNGYMDLCITGGGGGVKVFNNISGELETTPSWSTDAIDGGTALDFGDIDGDGYPDLAVAGGYGDDLLVFRNLGGVLESTPSYNNVSFSGPSCVAWADVDADGDQDLGITTWTHTAGVLENIGGVLTDTLVWSIELSRSILDISWGDYDNDKVVDTSVSVVSGGVSGLITLGRKPLHRLYSVHVDGQPLQYSDYCYDLKEGWISLASTPDSGISVDIAYAYSRDLDASVASSRLYVYENKAFLRWEYQDPDGDSVLNIDDNCPDDYNPEQADSDDNGIGDACCCVDITGNTDDDPDGVVDIGDLTTLIDYLFISFEPIGCPAEGNADGDPDQVVDIGDLTSIIDYLFISFEAPAPCPTPIGSVLEIPLGSPVLVDGIMASGEWSDAVVLAMSIEDVVDATVHVKHDGENLLSAFVYSFTDGEVDLPCELFFDVNNDKTPDWQTDDWWFHVSASDCEARGTFDVYTDCLDIQPDWSAAPNATGSPLDTIEIEIPFVKIGIDTGCPIGIALHVWNWPDGHGFWPPYAVSDSPSTWGTAVLKP